MLAPAFAGAMPPVFEPAMTLADPRFREIESVGIDGDYAVVAYAAEVWDDEEEELLITRAPVVYRRDSSGAWQYMQTLQPETVLGEYRRPGYVAIRGNVVAHVTSQLRVFERTASGWQLSATEPYPVVGEAWDVDIDNGTILVAAQAGYHAEAQAYRKNASGTWVRVGTGRSAPTPSENPSSAHGAISGNTVILATSRLADRTGAAYFFTGAPATWTAPSQTVSYPFGNYFPVAVSGDLAILNGADLYQRSGGLWNFRQALERAEFGFEAAEAKISGNLAAVYVFGSISIYQVGATGSASEIARLIRPGGPLGASKLDISGRRVIALDHLNPRTEAYIYELPATLPTQPALIQDTFQSGNASRWTPLAGGSWSVATTPVSRVYRQASVAADATSVLANSDWANQSIQADIRPTAFSGSDRWFGLAVRRVDAANYYYLTARSSGIVQLKKMVNGAFETLASAGLDVSVGADYRLRLEAIGSTITAYVNDVALTRVVDSSLTHGQAALMTYKTTADYDNVIVSPSPQATLLMDEPFIPWTRVAGQWSVVESPQWTQVQSSTAGGASAVTGHSTTDQSIEARIQQTAVGTGTQPWFGLLARYRDANNYYYVTIRNSNEISLRRLLNGAIQVLDSAPFSVSTGIEYPLRLEAIQDQLRVYVGERLVLEATDATFSEGRYGAVMYKSATAYEGVRVTQP